MSRRVSATEASREVESVLIAMIVARSDEPARMSRFREGDAGVANGENEDLGLGGGLLLVELVAREFDHGDSWSLAEMPNFVVGFPQRTFRGG